MATKTTSKFKEVDINAKSDKRRTAVYEATRNRHWHILRVLVRRNADVYVPTEDHETAMHHAVSYGVNMIAALLLEKGAKTTIEESAETRRGDTALHIAVRKNSLYLCRKLVDAMGNRLNKMNGAKQTAKELAVDLGRSQKMIQVLTEM